MAMHPSTQQQAQAEIDSVCDSQRRLPTFADKASLPYVEALVLEVLRWSAITPLGLPHRFTEDVEYQGLHFRKNMHAFANIALVILLDALYILWLTHRPYRAISFDPESYPEPDSFRPERFLGPTPQPDPRKIVFGYGRRICPGAALAEQIMFIVISSTLATFDIKPRKGEVYSISRTDGVIA
ncbi:hypothetical protein EIP86_006702 [Pleurotus ostreatoroseus]|nr:hypothetical protein EIP86_006702 [Pleurotus ostreatoroseus]